MLLYGHANLGFKDLAHPRLLRPKRRHRFRFTGCGGFDSLKSCDTLTVPFGLNRQTEGSTEWLSPTKLEREDGTPADPPMFRTAVSA